MFEHAVLISPTDDKLFFLLNRCFFLFRNSGILLAAICEEIGKILFCFGSFFLRSCEQ